MVDERDIHKRKKKVTSTLKHIEENPNILNDNARAIMGFNDYLRALRSVNIDRRHFYLCRLSVIAKWFDKPFKEATKGDIMKFQGMIEESDYTEWTKRDYLITLKKFYPSLFELRELIESEKISPASPWYQYKERNLGRLSLMTGFSGKIFDCSSGLPLDQLLDRKLVFELKEPNQYVTSFFVEAILTWLYYYRDAMGHRQEMKHAILFDEAKRVFDVNRERQPESGWPPIDDLVGKVREFGEAVIVADHEPSKLTDSLMANTNVKIWMSLGSGKDIDEMARVFGLDSDEVDYTRTMEKGNALLKIADRDPVPITLQDYTLEKDVTEEDIRQAMQTELQHLGWRERYRPEEFLVRIGKGEEEKPAISKAARMLLVSVRNNPLIGLSERYKMLGFGSKKGNAAKDELVQEGFVSEVEIRAGKKGRNPKLLEITKEGRQLLEGMGYRVRFKSKGGVEHQFWQKEVQKYYLKQGYDAFIEHHIGERSIDVYVAKKDKKIAVEIALSPEHELENVKKCLKEGFDQVQIVYLSRRVRDKIKRSIEEKFGKSPRRFYSPMWRNLPDSWA